MKLTLINPPWYFRTKPALSQNLALGYIAAYLEKHGHEVKFIDALAEGFSIREEVKINNHAVQRVGLPYKTIAEMVPADSFFVCISAPFTNHARIIRELAPEIRRRLPSARIVVGGVYASTLPEDALASGADFVVVGEGEKPLLELARGKKPEKIKGLLFRKGRRIISTGRAEAVKNLDSLPFPARHLMPMETYVRNSPRGRVDLKTASIITSRGCPFDCSFCSVHAVSGYGWRARSAENVIAEIRELAEMHGVEHIEFEDDNLTLERKRAMELFEGLAELNGKLRKPVTWAAPNGIRINSLGREMLALMKRSGCISLNLALEHGSREMLRKMNKQVDLEKAEEVVGLCSELRLPISIFVIVGYPGETGELFEEGLNFLKRLRNAGAKRFLPFFAQPYPGTRLFEYCREEGYFSGQQDNSAVYGVDEPAIVTEDFNIAELWERKKRIETEANSAIFRYETAIRAVVPRGVLLMLKRRFSF